MVVAALPIVAGVEGLKIASSVMITGIKTLYGIFKDINEFLDEHIEQMMLSENPTVSRTGRIFEMAKFGFGMGYISSVVIIAVGQLILGNPLSVVTHLATAATLTNPIAMTCAAVGAIYYGWSALSEQEKNEMLEKLSQGLEIGIEMVKSVIRFIIEKTKEIWTSDNLTEIRGNIKKAAEVFGKTLSDVTNDFVDKVGDGLDTVKDYTVKVVDKTSEYAAEAVSNIKESISSVVEKLKPKEQPLITSERKSLGGEETETESAETSKNLRTEKDDGR